MKNSSDTIGNGTRDLPACSAVPQPTVPLRAPTKSMKALKIATESTEKLIIWNLTVFLISTAEFPPSGTLHDLVVIFLLMTLSV